MLCVVSRWRWARGWFGQELENIAALQSQEKFVSPGLYLDRVQGADRGPARLVGFKKRTLRRDLPLLEMSRVLSGLRRQVLLLV